MSEEIQEKFNTRGKAKRKGFDCAKPSGKTLKHNLEDARKSKKPWDLIVPINQGNTVLSMNKNKLWEKYDPKKNPIDADHVKQSGILVLEEYDRKVENDRKGTFKQFNKYKEKVQKLNQFGNDNDVYKHNDDDDSADNGTHGGTDGDGSNKNVGKRNKKKKNGKDQTTTKYDHVFGNVLKKGDVDKEEEEEDNDDDDEDDIEIIKIIHSSGDVPLHTTHFSGRYSPEYYLGIQKNHQKKKRKDAKEECDVFK